MKYESTRSLELRKTLDALAAELRAIKELNKKARLGEILPSDVNVSKDHRTMLELKYAIARDNYRASLAYDIVPYIVDVINKYAGKVYGPRTSEKLHRDFRESTGCYITIYGCYSSDGINIAAEDYSHNGVHNFNMTFYVKDLFVKGTKKINPLTADKVEIYGIPAICDDISERAADIIAMNATVQNAVSALNKNISELRSLLPKSIECDLNTVYINDVTR